MELSVETRVGELGKTASDTLCCKSLFVNLFSSFSIDCGS